MADEQGKEGIKELTAWLQADDARGRATRARRLRDLLDILPVPPDGLSFLGGEESVICFDEVRRCYLDGSDMAVVLLCLAYIERELAAALYAAGWEGGEESPTGSDTGDGLRRRSPVRIRMAHLSRAGTPQELACPLPRTGSPGSMLARVVEDNALATEILAKDARRAVQAMARIVKRQSGMRVALRPSDE